MNDVFGLPLLLPCSEATARLLGVTRAQLYRLAHIEGLFTQLGGRRYLRRDALLRHLGLICAEGGQ